MDTFVHLQWPEYAAFSNLIDLRGKCEMPVRVKSHVRRRRGEPDEPPEIQEAKVIVYAPGLFEAPPRRLSIREKLKRDLAIPKKKPRKKTSMEDFADDAAKLALTLEKMEE